MKKFILVTLLISCTKIIKNLNFINKDINEDLVKAIYSNNNKVIGLINNGANVNYIHNGMDILNLAINKENLYIVRTLIEKGAIISSVNLIKIYNLALSYFSYELIDLIKDSYKLVDNKISFDKYLLLLCYILKAKEVQIFIEKNIIIFNNLKNQFHGKLLIAVSIENKIDIFKMLVEKYNFDINSKNVRGITPLIATCFKNSKDIIEFILERDINVNERDNNGYTALMIASSNGYKELVEVLINKGANVNEKNNKDWTALRLASL